ncbi:class I SAM-dependent methyltransferase [Nocardia transvalensis]|uniref:class I SAM-dependent methyltransferase n=1 Tax=Nocardia transvalensis TaxID=37333 RepID=UPI001894F1E6|nr:class I SAM-dependent methyltransferase [Nocardia transvalensis]MBF6329067.1 class I SAM-dependent methyltransferase [Nocardia transvalensis]
MGSIDISKDEFDGARAYSPLLLRAYDICVLGFNNSFVWRCPTRNLRRLYDGNVSADHLDIGPGTGWHLRHACYPVAHPKVTLADLNPHPLDMASRRLRRRGIEAVTRVGSVLHPLPVDRRYTSVATSLLMHCVPGGWDSKGVAFRHIADATADDGVFFGATILAHGVPHTRLSRAVQASFNDRGVFHNRDDDLDGLIAALERSFGTVQVDTVGSVALWTARTPKRT